MHYIFFKPPKFTLKDWVNAIHNPRKWGAVFSILTAWATNGRYCHCGIIETDERYNNRKNKLLMLHAWWTVKHDYVHDILNKTNYAGYYIVSVENPSYRHEKALEWARSQLRMPYDVLGLLSLIRVIFFRLFLNKDVDYKYQLSWAWYCSELAKHAIKQGGINVPDEPMSPNALYRFIVSDNERMRKQQSSKVVRRNKS